MSMRTDLDRRIAAIRGFNRFYTRRIGVLQDKLLGSSFSLGEARLLYELARRDQTTASELGEELSLDAGYLSRMMASFETRGLLHKTRSPEDRRQYRLSLTKAGHAAFVPLEARAKDEIEAMLRSLTEAQQLRLLAGMEAIETVFGVAPKSQAPFLLRPHRCGDIGWVIARHGALYAEEFGWNEQFEALVAEVAGKFLRRFDARSERCWIAEIDGANVGSVFLVRRSRTTAQLRLLLVEPKARGLGIGKKLVEECIRFARQAGYRKIMLWTNSVLHGARRLYEQAGFTLIGEERHKSFGADLTGETWTLDLRKPAHGTIKARRVEKPWLASPRLTR